MWMILFNQLVQPNDSVIKSCCSINQIKRHAFILNTINQTD